MILLDTSGLFAAYDGRHPRQAAALATAQQASTPRFLSPFVLAELDYLVTKWLGQAAELSLLDEVSSGAYEIVEMTALDVGEARDVIDRYADLNIGLADASIVVLSRRHGVNDVLTLDERHFRVLRGARDRPFRVLPADA